MFHKHEDGREEDGKGPIVKMSEGNINPNVLNRRSLEINRSTRPFEISCKFQKLWRISYSSDTKYQVEYFLPLLINLLYLIGNKNDLLERDVLENKFQSLILISCVF